jgi:hypothetical protein
MAVTVVDPAVRDERVDSSTAEQAHADLVATVT